MGYEFVADGEALESLHTTITTEAENVKTALDEVYKIFESMGTTHWVGSNYDKFIAAVNARKEELYKSYDAFVKFGEQVAAAQTDAGTMFDEIGI